VSALAALAPAEASGRSRQALLHFRKRIEGRRVTRLRRVAGERTVVLEAGDAVLALRLSGSAPALTLAVAGLPIATLGNGAPAWPAPADDFERECDRLQPVRLLELIADAPRAGRTPRRGLLAAFPPLGPTLCRWLVAGPERIGELRAGLASPVPSLLVPRALEDCRDVDLAPEDAVALVPMELDLPGRIVERAASWQAAAALFLGARMRGDAFARGRRRALESARRELRRLSQLEAHLVRDQARLPAAQGLRRLAEALLASPEPVPPGAAQIEKPDPYDPGVRLVIPLEPRLGMAANADRLFDKARRAERGGRQIAARLTETRARLAASRASERRLLEASDLAEIEPPALPQNPGSAAPKSTSGPRHYLTSRGLSLLAGRGARENHQLTFAMARPEDVWLHARDVPGAHVILRDGEGRAGAEDLREAAEVAAFFSEARAQPQVDVHVTRRKHVRPAPGGPGRVRVGHSETLRVMPRDPEGRLRRR
jgi:predicted ribosome quality control (RQC) complex YloA/Tae2 family protein